MDTASLNQKPTTAPIEGQKKAAASPSPPKTIFPDGTCLVSSVDEVTSALLCVQSSQHRQQRVNLAEVDSHRPRHILFAQPGATTASPDTRSATRPTARTPPALAHAAVTTSVLHDSRSCWAADSLRREAIGAGKEC